MLGVAHVPSILLTAAGAFVGTNIDDFAVLLLIVVSAPPEGARMWRVAGGQYLGFAAIVAVSLAGAAALHAVPLEWAGLFGAVPVLLGIWGLLRLRRPGDEAGAAARADSVTAVALLTIAGGADNVSVYVPLFRRLDGAGTALTLAVFAVLLAVWCAAALLAGRYARLVPAIVRAGRWLSPCLYIAIGVIILVSTGALAHLA
jgi:cadmium resistance protein CadD (predicted permease)